MMDLNKQIRFGVIADGDTLEWWQNDTVKLLTDNGIELVLIAKDIDADTAQSLDFILTFKEGKISENLLNCPRYGVWKLANQGLWDFLHKKPTSQVILQKLVNEPNKPLIIRSIQLDTIFHSYNAHRERLLRESEMLPLQACKDLIINGNLNLTEEDTALETHKPNVFQKLRCRWLSFWRRIGFHYRYFCRQEDWNVGYDNGSIHWLKPPKHDYFADPFVFTANDDTYLFFEWYSYKNGKGDIAVAKKSENFEIYHKITDFPEHRSYPFIFEYQGVIYCIPEANQTGKVSLYKFVETGSDATDSGPSLRWECDLLEGRFVDSTLYHHSDGKWYLFTTPQKQSHTHLLIYVADDLRGPYRPHYNNPVKVDCANSRMAGKIQNIDSDLVRPAQNSIHHYGESITLNKIVQLNEYQYIEKVIKEIKPDKKWTYNKGIHTINSDGEITVFDAKRFMFTWRGFIQQIRQKTTTRHFERNEVRSRNLNQLDEISPLPTVGRNDVNRMNNQC